MELQKVCLKAIEYSSEKYIAHIVKNDVKWIVSMCDKAGHDLFIASIAIDRETEAVYDYSPLDDECEDIYKEERVPAEYQSDKEKVITLVLINKGIDIKYKNLLDTIYEKYDLYNVSQYVSYSILNYYCSIIFDFDDAEISEDAYRFIMTDNRTIEELISESSPFCFESN